MMVRIKVKDGQKLKSEIEEIEERLRVDVGRRNGKLNDMSRAL
jgi:hypothetical protein